MLFQICNVMFKYDCVPQKFNLEKWQVMRLSADFKRFLGQLDFRKPVAVMACAMIAASLLIATTPAHALTPSTSSSSYVDVPFNCEAKFYQTGRPSAKYPTSNDTQDLRLFTYDPFSNTFTAGEKTLDFTKYFPNGFGYRTADNFIYGINDNKVLNAKKIVRLDATGNFKDLGTYIHNDPVTGNPLQENKGDYWNKENKLIIGAFNNYATVDVTNLGTQTAQRLAITHKQAM